LHSIVARATTRTPRRPTENPERWECQCDPEAVWTAVWRILTPERVRRKFAHLSTRRTPARDAQRRELRAHIVEIRQSRRNAMPLCTTSTTVPSRPCVSPTDMRPGSPGPGATGGSDDSSDGRRRASRPGAVIRTPLPIGATEADALTQVWAMLLQVYPDIHLRAKT